MQQINIADFFANSIKVFSGRDKGEKCRNDANIDFYDQSDDIIEVIINKNIFTVSSSFFLGMFGKSVRKLGEEEFRRKYLFLCEDAIRRNIEVGIKDALKRGSVFDV